MKRRRKAIGVTDYAVGALVIGLVAIGVEGGVNARQSSVSRSSAASSSGSSTTSAATATVSNAAPTASNCAVYQNSGPIVVKSDNQIIRNLAITSSNGPAINTNGHSGVRIENVSIHHRGGPGIQVNGSQSVTVTGADIVFDGAPSSGPNPTGYSTNNIECYGSSGLTVTNTRVTRGGSGIYLEQCSGSALSFIEGHDQRGPLPRGQLVQWNASNNGSLTDFSNVASLSTSWTEDNVNIYQSTGITIARGLVDTNTSPSGDGVLIDEQSGNVTVTDVDAIHQGNGCFGIWGGGGHDVTFTNTRCRDNYCSLPRGKPASGSLGWAIDTASKKGDLNIANSSYFNLCNEDNIVWDDDMLHVEQLTHADFTARAPIAVQLCQ